MRILVISKRQYTGKDLLDDAYGRIHELPLELARLGHEVRGVCASYRARPEGEFRPRRDGVEVSWQALNVRPFSPASLYRWVATVQDAAHAFRPDMIWACSDSFHAMLGTRTQQRCGIPCVIDLYDNFESFAGTRLPGVRTLFRSAVRQAAGVTCVSPPLERKVREHYHAKGKTIVLENGVGAEFRPLERTECRKRFGLPAEARIIGTAGAISSERDIEVLFRAFLRLAAQLPDLHLLLAGPVLGSIRIPRHARIVYLGQLPHTEVPHVIGALNVAVVCNKHSAFGDYCFPQKLYEIIACRVPPAVAGTLGVAHLLEAWPENRYEPGSEASLTQAIERLLARPTLPATTPQSWSRHARTLSAFFEEVRPLSCPTP